MRTAKGWAPWTDADHHKLAALVARGDTWKSIAEAFGRSVGACEQQHKKFVSAEKRREISAHRLKLARERRKSPTQEAPPTFFQAPAGPPSRRRISNAALMVDAELRARIATQGPTAGLLGDPLPGCSALDKRNAGIVEELPPSNHREVYYASRPRITLATGPMR